MLRCSGDALAPLPHTLDWHAHMKVVHCGISETLMCA
jgi:hypothetical protein